MANIIQIRRDTTANWNTVDPIMADGELGYDMGTKTLKVGDGITVFTSLPANGTTVMFRSNGVDVVSTATVDFVGSATVVNAGGVATVTIPAVPVDSVFGRTGVIVSANGDYTSAQVTYDPALTSIVGVNIQTAMEEVSANQDKYLGGAAGQIIEKVSGAAHDVVWRDKPTSLLSGAGRIYMYADDRWITPFDDLYGDAHYNKNHTGGTGATPTHTWKDLGLVIPAGRTLKTLHIAGRSNNVSVQDMEVYVVLRTPTASNGWETGVDADGEVTSNPIYQDSFMNPVVGAGFLGDTNDIHWRKINLNAPLTEDTMVLFYVRPNLNTSGSTRYFYMTWTLEVE